MSAIDQLTTLAESNGWKVVWSTANNRRSNPSYETTLSVCEENSRLIFGSAATGFTKDDSEMKAARAITKHIYSRLSTAVEMGIDDLIVLKQPKSSTILLSEAIRSISYRTILFRWCNEHGYTILSPKFSFPSVDNETYTCEITAKSPRNILIIKKAQYSTFVGVEKLATYLLFNALVDLHDTPGNPVEFERGTVSFSILQPIQEQTASANLPNLGVNNDASTQNSTEIVGTASAMTVIQSQNNPATDRAVTVPSQNGSDSEDMTMEVQEVVNQQGRIVRYIDPIPSMANSNAGDGNDHPPTYNEAMGIAETVNLQRPPSAPRSLPAFESRYCNFSRQTMQIISQNDRVQQHSSAGPQSIRGLPAQRNRASHHLRRPARQVSETSISD